MVNPERDVGVLAHVNIQRVQCPAVRVTADNNILHFQVRHRIFQNSCKVPVMRWNNVSDISMSEQLSCTTVCDTFRIHTRIRTADPENRRVLGGRQLHVAIFLTLEILLQKDFVAFKETVNHKTIPR